ncbi:MAG TPA: TetR/AcrR family transcriptional regulator [Solirubrobacteraceae bacterium]|jgi:AcrR family transcriptional regulator
MSGSDSKRKYEQTARAQAQERTREALLDAARDEFFGNRWSKASLNTLAEKAGVTKQTLLRHFGSKNGLLTQALLRGAAEVREQRWSVPKGDVWGTIANLLDHYERWGAYSLRVGSWQDSTVPLATLSQGARQVHYDWVDFAFKPWLEQLEGDERERVRAALVSFCDVHVWWVLSHDMGMDRQAVEGTLTLAVERLLEVRR